MNANRPKNHKGLEMGITTSLTNTHGDKYNSSRETAGNNKKGSRTQIQPMK